MSLQVEGHHRGRSRSPGGRERDRSRSRGAPLVVDASPNDYRYEPDSYQYEEDYRRVSSSSYRPQPDDYYRRPKSPAAIENNGARTSYGELREKDLLQRRDSPRERHSDSDREHRDGKRASNRSTGLGLADAFLPQKYSRKLEESDAYNLLTSPISDRSRERSRDRRAEKKEKRDEDLAYGRLPPDMRPVSPRPLSPASPSAAYGGYAYGSTTQQPQQQQQYVNYPAELPTRHSPDRLEVGDTRHGRSRSRSRNREKSPAPRHHSRHESLTVDPRASSSYITAPSLDSPTDVPRKSALKRSSSPQPPVARMSNLSVNTAYNAGASLSAAPPSPLLESYHGTYQSMSPMPSPLLIPTNGFGGIHGADPLDPLDLDDEPKKRSRRARFADPQDDAQRLADALKGDSRRPATEPLVEILPGLTHEQVMDLRVAYKQLVKTGREKKGVNVAKHIRVRLKDEDPSLMKACYATALGRWESEAYWSSFWYQGDKTRRELLIESLMGRTNDEIRMIKDAFSDKTYDNSLTRCMKHELKEDKFKKAVLMVLDEQRMEEVDRYGHPLRVEHDLVVDDVRELHRAVKAEKGGESAMINIVVNRSDSHLREVLTMYNDQYRSNFARDALRKSGNLVGELLAHILNGVINKPVRDALLVHHALTASKKDALRRELLTSRLVRYHWDVNHMVAVKVAYRERYGKDMMEAVRDGTSGEWGQFCEELCITRMPDTLKQYHVTR